MSGVWEKFLNNFRNFALGICNKCGDARNHFGTYFPACLKNWLKASWRILKIFTRDFKNHRFKFIHFKKYYNFRDNFWRLKNRARTDSIEYLKLLNTGSWKILIKVCWDNRWRHLRKINLQIFEDCDSRNDFGKDE